ncbi:MAG TPA: iron-siderophore ABC transporter substrate-binding protein [Thermomicrobiales bacterium]|nr:iron-siderophore ABC transporter substrate-binding protein [Thermomicrobiales bacterium]
MTLSHVSRRHVLGGMTALSLGALLPGVSASAQSATPDDNADEAFPVTIPHVYGETVIAEEPKRVVTLSWINQDVVISLGVIPVGMPFNAWGGDEEGYLPWTREAIGDNPAPVLFDDSVEIPFETIIDLEPDVIIGVFSAISQDEYNTLSAIAPTVAYPEVPFGTSWQDTTRIIGQILGKADEAEELLKSTEDLIAHSAVEYPQIKDKTFTYASVNGSESVNVYTVIDVRVQLMTSMGMKPSPFSESLEIGDDRTAYFVGLSFERVNEIDGDLLIMWFANQDDADALAEMPVMKSLPFFQNGTFVPVVGEPYVMASSAPSPLSIPYMLDEYVPQIAAAADNVPE